MDNKRKFQFGVLMDSQHATIVGRNDETQEFEFITNVKAPTVLPNSNENTANNDAKTSQGKFFKDILSNMQNATDIYVTGGGVTQEQFINFLGETPQFKNTKTINDTLTNLSQDDLVSIMEDKFK